MTTPVVRRFSTLAEHTRVWTKIDGVTRDLRRLRRRIRTIDPESTTESIIENVLDDVRTLKALLLDYTAEEINESARGGTGERSPGLDGGANSAGPTERSRAS